MVENGYPKYFIHNQLKPKKTTQYQNVQKDREQYIAAPYVRGTSERVAKILKPFNINLRHRTSNSLKNKLCKLKDKRKDTEKKDVVYKIECEVCPSIYVGETGRQLGQRLMEHDKAVIIKMTPAIYINTTRILAIL